MNHAKKSPDSNFIADLSYQKTILGSVSRTFALTIPLLPPGIEIVVGNTYLLCRIVDTIEDAAELNAPTKQLLSALFLDAVFGRIPVEDFVRPCIEALKNYGNRDELDLISHTPTVLRILHTFSSKDQEAISRCIGIMSEGMTYFHGKQNQSGLHNLAEFEHYCYVVAGVVGELLTTIFSNHSPTFKENISGHENLAVAFGQALQMTNILKDSPEDQARGVSWKPVDMNEQDLLKLAYQKLQDSIKYILLIPKKEYGMRRFCFLAFGLAVMTLSKIALRKKIHSNKEVKLTRKAVMVFYNFTKFAVKSDSMMQIFFKLSSQSLQKQG